jgi:hypothetical protein
MINFNTESMDKRVHNYCEVDTKYQREHTRWYDEDEMTEKMVKINLDFMQW